MEAKENRDHHKDSNATQTTPNKRPKGSAPKKQGMDRRIKVKDAAFKEQMNTKLAGKDVPTTLRVSCAGYT